MAQDFVKIFGVRIDKLTNDDAFNKFVAMLKKDRISTIYTPNTEIVMRAKDNEELRNIILDADMVMPDGIGLIYASKIHKLGLIEKVAGSDMMDKMLKYLNTTKKSMYILGGAEGVPELAVEKIAAMYPDIDIKGYHHGYFELGSDLEYKIIDNINELKPDVLFVGLGSPRQENWIHDHKKILNCKVAMGIGGMVDIYAGILKRAPRFMIKLGLEWLYRFGQEPTRVKRMLILPRFMIKVLLSKEI